MNPMAKEILVFFYRVFVLFCCVVIGAIISSFIDDYTGVNQRLESIGTLKKCFHGVTLMLWGAAIGAAWKNLSKSF
jgi:hypothetical protein